MTENLNQAVIHSENRHFPSHTLRDHATSQVAAKVEAVFRDVESRLISFIGEADIVVGCVAWLTNWVILEEMARKTGVSIIVQKEDFLRPDGNKQSQRRTRELYAALPSALCRYDEGLIGTVLYGMSCCADPTIEAVRCAGNHNSDRSPSHARVHHKFVVACRSKPPVVYDDDDDGDHGEPFENYEPYAVWTGSFNFSYNATKSLENAVIINDEKIASAYFREWGQVAAISEPLDWRTPWSEPQWRIGS